MDNPEERVECSSHHQLVGDLGDDHPEGEDVEAGVQLKELAGGLLKDDEGQGEDEANMEAGGEHTGVLQETSSPFSTANVQQTMSTQDI